jgi:uncharacterized protein (DUF305 family)
VVLCRPGLSVSHCSIDHEILPGVLRVIPLVIALAAALLIAACGEAEVAGPAKDPVATDDAFVVRIARHQQTGLALARSAATGADVPSVRKLARTIAGTREALLPAISDRLADVPDQAGLPDLGVSEAQAAEAITPTALDGAKPLDPAFLTLMTEHNRGAIALAKAELSKGKDPAVKALAQRIAAEAAGELNDLSDELVAFATHG